MENYLIIQLKTIDDVKRFVCATKKCLGEVNISSSRSTVNAKSIMGIMSLSLADPLRVDTQGYEDLFTIARDINKTIVIESFSFVV